MSGPHVFRHLAQEVGLTPEVEQHLAECTDCRAVSQTLQARQSDLDRALAAFDRAVPFDAAFAAAKEAASSSIAARQRRWWETRFNGAIVAIAAAVTFAVLFGTLFSKQPQPATFVSMQEVDEVLDELHDEKWDARTTVRWQRTTDDLMDMVYDYDHESVRSDPTSKRRMFRLLTALGNSADNGNYSNERIYADSGPVRNLGWRWAGCMAAADRDLMNREWPYEEMARTIENTFDRIEKGDVPCPIDADGVLILPEDVDLTPDWDDVGDQIADVASLDKEALDATAWGELALHMDDLAKSSERFASNRRQEELVFDAFAQVARVAKWGTYPPEYRGWPVAEGPNGTLYDVPMMALQSRVLANPKFVKRLPTQEMRDLLQAYVDEKSAQP